MNTFLDWSFRWSRGNWSFDGIEGIVYCTIVRKRMCIESIFVFKGALCFEGKTQFSEVMWWSWNHRAHFLFLPWYITVKPVAFTIIANGNNRVSFRIALPPYGSIPFPFYWLNCIGLLHESTLCKRHLIHLNQNKIWAMMT